MFTNTNKTTISQRTLSATRKRGGVDENASKMTWKSAHTYTKESHENLLRNLTQADLDELKKENKKLRMKVGEAEEAGRRKQQQIEALERQLEKMEKTRKDNGEVYRQTEDKAVEFAFDFDHPDTADLLSHHFSEVIRRHNHVLAEKDVQIRELQQLLAECRKRGRGLEYNNGMQSDVLAAEDSRGERQLRDHVYDYHRERSSERLRRNEAAVKAFSNGLDQVKTQLRSVPPEERYHAVRGSRSELVVRELGRRRHWGMVADVERLADSFVRRLKLEEQLDRHYWKLETDRLAVYKKSVGDRYDPRCTYNKDYEQLEITRHNLLKTLAELRAKKAADEYKKVHFQDKSADPESSFTTIQTLYNRPERDKMADSSASEVASRGPRRPAPDKQIHS